MNTDILLWTGSDHCAARREGRFGTSCRLCRSSQRYRVTLSHSFRLPGDNINFACPHGVPWPGEAPLHVTAQPPNPKHVSRLLLPGTWLSGFITVATFGLVRPCANCSGRIQVMDEAGWLGLPWLFVRGAAKACGGRSGASST